MIRDTVGQAGICLIESNLPQLKALEDQLYGWWALKENDAIARITMNHQELTIRKFSMMEVTISYSDPELIQKTVHHLTNDVVSTVAVADALQIEQSSNPEAIRWALSK